MGSDNAFFSKVDLRLPLRSFISVHGQILQGDPARVVTPLLQCVAKIHAGGDAHGAISDERLFFFPEGTLDEEFFRIRSTGKLSSSEIYYYYPSGQGASLEERQRFDLQALGCVLYFFIFGTAPPPRNLRGDNPLSRLAVGAHWPPAFVQLVDGLLATEEGHALPTLESLIAALAVPAQSPQAPPAPAPAPAEAAPVAELPQPAPIVAVTPSGPPQRLPNATVNRAFSCELLPLLTLGGKTFAEVMPQGSLPDGLTCDGSLLKGTPKASGEFEIELHCRLSLVEADRPAALSRKVLITINPDPQSLWKTIDSDKSVPYWKLDADKDSLTDSPHLVAAASLRGRSHAHVGSCRDDDFSIAWYPECGWYSLTVLDGAGSSKFSRHGSKIASVEMRRFFDALFANAASDSLSKLVDSLTAEPDNAEAQSAVRGALYQQFGTAALAARKAIDDHATAVNATIRDFHTTLITALARPLANGAWFIASFAIGDGGAAVVGDANACLLTRPDGGEFAGQTVFLTMKEALATGETIMNRIRFVIVPKMDALILVTDGVSDPRFESEVEMADPAAWSRLWTEVQPLVAEASSRDEAAQRLLEWMKFPSPGHHDDRTIAVLCETHLPPVL